MIIVMGTPANPYLTPAVALFAVLAIAFAGFGGLAGADDHRTLLAVGSTFWLLMLLVPIMFFSSGDSSWTKQSCVGAAYGALTGTCVSLCFAPGQGWGSLVAYAAGGGLTGYISYWTHIMRTRAFWRGH